MAFIMQPFFKLIHQLVSHRGDTLSFSNGLKPLDTKTKREGEK